MTGTATHPFSRTLWEDNRARYDAIVAMPFNAELAEGTLAIDAFRRYIVQDAHYLEGFARALALAAAKADKADQVAMLASSAAGAIHVERSLHETYFSQFGGVTPDELASTESSPVCSHYVSFLLATAGWKRFRSPSPRCCPASGSTGKSASRSRRGLHRDNPTAPGSKPIPARRSTPRSAAWSD